jgi:hypothetical protein
MQSYSFQLTPQDAELVAIIINAKANQAYYEGNTNTGNALDKLGQKFASISFQAHLMGYEDADLMEFNCQPNK